MKKKFLLMLAVLTAMATLCACSNNNAADSSNSDSNTEEVAQSEDVNPSDYVTLGEYEGIEVEVELGTVSENAIEEQIKMELDYYIQSYQLYDYEAITDRVDVQNGDVVNIDYVGKKDGVAFDGGTAQGSYLGIGTGTFIPGFEEGLVGVKVNETVDLDLTFPEDYGNTELAGQAVVFTVTVNGIYDAASQKMPEYNDELIQKLNAYGMTFTTMDEYRADVKSYLETQQQTANENAKVSAMWQAVRNTCEIAEPPAEMVERIKQRVYDNAQNYADQYGMELNAFIEQSMQVSVEEFEAEAQKAATESAKDLLVVKAIAKQQEIIISKKQLQELQEQEATAAGSTVEEYFNGVPEEEFYEYALTQQVYEYLQTVVTVLEK